MHLAHILTNSAYLSTFFAFEWSTYFNRNPAINWAARYCLCSCFICVRCTWAVGIVGNFGKPVYLVIHGFCAAILIHCIRGLAHSSVYPFVCLSVLYGPLTRKQRHRKSKIGMNVTVVPIFSLKVQWSRSPNIINPQKMMYIHCKHCGLS